MNLGFKNIIYLVSDDIRLYSLARAGIMNNEPLTNFSDGFNEEGHKKRN